MKAFRKASRPVQAPVTSQTPSPALSCPRTRASRLAERKAARARHFRVAESGSRVCGRTQRRAYSGAQAQGRKFADTGAVGKCVPSNSQAPPSPSRAELANGRRAASSPPNMSKWTLRERLRPLLREAGKGRRRRRMGGEAGRSDRECAVTVVQSDFGRSSGPHPIRRLLCDRIDRWLTLWIG
jgi:hypothetical protein